MTYIASIRNVRIKVAVTLLCALGFFIGFKHVHPFALRIFYPFFHANIFHLIVNLIALWSIKNRMEWAKGYLICVSVGFLPMYLPEPTVGLSGFLFAVFGLMWGKANQLGKAIKTVAPIIIISMLLPNINGLIHLYAFVAGYLINYISSRLL